MKKVKITIVKTMLNEDLAKEYGIPGLKACPMMKVGDVFYADYAKPEGFCDEAWKAIYQYVFALAHGADKGPFYYGDWIKEPGIAIVSCNDGLRPVIMKLEATDEEASMHRQLLRRWRKVSVQQGRSVMGCHIVSMGDDGGQCHRLFPDRAVVWTFPWRANLTNSQADTGHRLLWRFHHLLNVHERESAIRA